VKVAVAIITDAQHRVLITQRPLNVPHGGCWEFPGGKLEDNEPAELALIREIREEVGLEILKCEYLGQINHQYPDKSVQLIVFHVSEFVGIPSCLEGQLDLRWVDKDNLKPEEFPEANRNIFNLIPILEEL
jgi:8-oxo-dGTP diphosphatase